MVKQAAGTNALSAKLMPEDMWTRLCSCAAISGSAERVPSACLRTRSRCATAGLRCRSPLSSLEPAQQVLPSARPSARASLRWQLTWPATGSSGRTAPLQQSPQRCLCRRLPAVRRRLQSLLAQSRSLMWQRSWPHQPLQPHRELMSRSCWRLSSCLQMSSWRPTSSWRALVSRRVHQGHQLHCSRRLPLRYRAAASQWPLLLQSRTLCCLHYQCHRKAVHLL